MEKTNSKSSLENIVEKLSNIPIKITNTLINNTLLMSGFGGLGGYLVSNFNIPLEKITYDNYKYLIPGAFLGYLISKINKNLERNISIDLPNLNYSDQNIKLKELNYLVYNSLTENPILSSLLTNLPLTEIILKNNSLEEKFTFYAVMSFLTEKYLRLMNVEKRIKKSKSNSKLSNIIFEHPSVLAFSVSVIRGSEVYYNLKKYSNIKDQEEIITKSFYSGLGYGLLAGLSCLVLGGILHSDSLRNIKHHLKIKKAELFGNKELELILRESLFLNDGPIKSINDVKIGNIYLEKNEKDKAFIHYKQAIKSLLRESHFNNYEFLISNFYSDIYSRIKNINKKVSNLDTAIICLANGNIDLSIKILEEEKLKCKTHEELSKINYLLLITGKYSKNNNLINLAANNLIANVLQEELLEITKSKNYVKTISGNFFDRELILKYGDFNALKKELLMTKEISKQLSFLNDPRFIGISPICVLPYKNNDFKEISGVYLMDYEFGETLAAKLTKNYINSKSIVNDVADFLGLIHAKIPIDIIQETRDHGYEISKRLKKLNVEERVLHNIQYSLPYFIEGIKNTDLVYDKDAHSENWMITSDNKVIVLDCENRVKNNRERDIANLTDTWDFFSQDEKYLILQRVNTSYSLYKGIKVDSKESKKSYSYAVIIKALEDIPVLYERKDYPRLNAVIANGLNAIKEIKSENKVTINNIEKIDIMAKSLLELKILLK